MSENRSWPQVISQIIDTVEPHVWLRDADIHNLSDGGASLEIVVSVIDSAWITDYEHGPQIYHRYEVDFYEKTNVRGKISVTFGLSYSFDYHADDTLGSDYIHYVENSNSDRLELSSKSGLYQHSWPHLRAFVRQTVESFFWDTLELPEKFTVPAIPLASSSIQGLSH